MDLKFLNRDSINKKLALLVFLAVLPALLIILYSGVEQRRNSIEKARRDVLLLTHTMTEVQMDVARSTRQILSILALLPEVHALDVQACSQIFSAVLKKNPNYQNITLTGLDGEVMASALPFKSANLGDRKHFREALTNKDFAVGEYIVSRVGNVAPALPFAYPVLDNKGQPVAVLTAAINLDFFAQLYDTSTLPEKTFIAVTDHQGLRLFYHPPQGGTNPLGKPIKASSWDIASKVAEKQGVFSNRSSDGDRRIFAFEKVYLDTGDVPYLYVWAGIPEADILEVANAALVRNLLLMFLAVALSLFIAWVMAKNTLIAPIRLLMGMTREFAEGNLAFRSEQPVNPDEFGELTEAFKQMAEALFKSETALREEMAFSKSLIDTAQAIILVLDMRGRILQFNPYMEEISGYPLAEVKGKDFLKTFLPKEDSSPSRTVFQEVVSGLQVRGTVHPIRTRDGQERQIDWYSKKLKDSSGNIMGVLAVGQDITEQKKAEEALRKLDQAKSEFITTVSHELRTPLTSIFGYAELLENTDIPSTEEQRESYLAIIQSNVEVLNRLVDDLLDVGCIQIGHSLGITPQATDPAGIIEKAIESAKAKCRQRKIHVLHSNPLPETLWIDRDRITQVLNNLLSNAIKYSPEGSEIVVQTVTDHDMVTVSVQDQGMGMTPQQVEHMFDRFYRAEDLSLKITGLGLGMTIAKQIIADHGGEIFVTSHQGEGTTVAFTLPIRRPVGS
jgi:PAS domain S-box-containing protein